MLQKLIFFFQNVIYWIGRLLGIIKPPENHHLILSIERHRMRIDVSHFIPDDPVSEMLNAHTHERSIYNIAKLQINSNLQIIAENHAQWMSDNKILSHNGAYGLSISDRAIHEGYKGITIGENLAHGYSTKSAMQSWMDSVDSRTNILRPQYTDCGIAKTSRYWCIVFGTPIISCDKRDHLGFEDYKPTEHISNPTYGKEC